MAVAQHLAEAEPELFFLVVVGDALDLGDEDGALCLPGEVEVRLVRQPGTRFDPRLAQDLRELVLGIGMALEAALDQRRVDGEGCRSPGSGLTCASRYAVPRSRPGRRAARRASCCRPPR